MGDDWVAGRDPETMLYCSPWVLATIKHDAIANPQGSVTENFTDRIVAECEEYLDDG